MTTLKEKVLKVLATSKDNVVPYYATISEANLQELNETITELGEQGVYPQIIEVTESFIELKFIKVLNGQRKYTVKVDTGKETFNVPVNGDTEIFFKS